MLNMCNLCELNNKSHIIVGEGSEKSEIMLIGECPGPEENKLMRPFVGKSGKLLRGALKNLGTEKNLYITNIVKCWPKPNLNPSPHHIKACSPLLNKQINKINPKLIITLGRFSTAHILGKDVNSIRITKLSGKIIKRKGRHILPVVHPSYVLRNKGNKEGRIEMMLNLVPMLEFHNEI